MPKFRENFNEARSDGADYKKFRTDKRRLNRQTQRESTRACFNCRKFGHLLADCPEAVDDPGKFGSICFKCGAADHTSSRCNVKGSDFKFATCFVCGEKGHLSRQCKQNEHGAYIKGTGCCAVCGRKDHLRKDCPRELEAEGGFDEGTEGAEVSNLVANADFQSEAAKSLDEDVSNCQDFQEIVKKKAKVVKF